MKKFFALAALAFAMLTAPYSYAASNQECCPQQAATEDCCPQDQPCGECWCLYCHYEPCYYTTRRCIEVPQYYKKKCCKYVPKYYEVKKCRYVPQYYTETCCKYEPEYYCEDECKMCKQWVCERQCKYVPRYYYKKVCNNNNCNTACPQDMQQEPLEGNADDYAEAVRGTNRSMYRR